MITDLFRNRLARRLGMYVILVSTFITIFTSGIQLYFEFERDVEQVNGHLDQIEKTQLGNIVSRVWVVDINELQNALDRIINLQAIQYIAVYDENNHLLAQSGAETGNKNPVIKKHSLHYFHNDKTFNIGSLIVEASLDGAYQRIIDHALMIIATNALKTFIVAGFILIIFFRLVTRHISKLTEFSERLSVDTLNDTFEFDRRKNPPHQQDDLDSLRTALSKMQLNLLQTTQDMLIREQDLSVTLNSIGDAVITTDSEGNITRMNPVAVRLTGWSVPDAQGRPIDTVFPIINASTRKPIENPIQKVLTTGATVYLSNNTTLISKNKTEYQIADSAAPIRNGTDEIQGMVLIFNDVTEQYQLRQAAIKSQRDLQAIMDNSPTVIYVKDREGFFTFINCQFEKVSNLSRNNIIGKTLHSVFPPNIASQIHDNDLAVLTTGDVIESEEIVAISGKTRIFSSIKFPLLNEDDEIYAVCSISTDITERRDQEEQLRRSQKMDALGTLTGGIAHDYNNMLSVIMGYTELLNLQLPPDQILRQHVQVIQNSAKRGAELTKKLLGFTRLQARNACVLNINTLLKEQQLMLEKTLTARISLIFDVSENLWSTLLDKGDLEDTIINISINAMHAIEGNGRITLSTRNEQLDPTEAKRLHVVAGDYVLLSISDTGCGMKETTKEHVFEPFFTTKNDKGTGLGLSQVYGFMQRSEGAIQIDTKLGQGTRFSLYFPRSHQSLAVKSISHDSVKMQGSETLLIVDDEPSLVSLAQEILSRHGYRIVTASNGEEALAVLQKEKVSLIISDVIMPKMDGYELAFQVQRLYPKIKIQLVSGFADDRVKKANSNLKLMFKPYTTEALLLRVRSVLDNDEQ